MNNDSDSEGEGEHWLPDWAKEGKAKPKNKFIDSDSEDEEEQEESKSNLAKQEEFLRSQTEKIFEEVDSDIDNDSIPEDKLNELNQIIDEELEFNKWNEFLSNHAVADEAIRETCIKVGIANLSSNAALLLPGVGKVVGLVVGMTAAGALTSKLQRNLIQDLAGVYGFQLTSVQQDRVGKIIMGAHQVAAVGKSGVALVAAKKVAAKSHGKFSKFAPAIGPVVSASVALTTTFVIGKRCKIYFSRLKKKLQEQDKREFEEGTEEEVEMESWNETMKMLTGVEIDVLSGYVNQAMSKCVNNFKATGEKAKQLGNQAIQQISNGKKAAQKLVKKYYNKKKQQEEEEQLEDI